MRLAVIAVGLLPERQCDTCTAFNKRRWGCDGGATDPIEIDGKPIQTCPRRWIKDEPAMATELFWYYRRYEKGVLPEDGGLQSQPAKFMEIMKVMDAAFSKVEDEKDRRRSSKAAQAESLTVSRRPRPRSSVPAGRVRRR